MTITEIIIGMETVQREVTKGRFDKITDEYFQVPTEESVSSLCNLSVNLALHVQQLEIDMRTRKGLTT